MRITLRLFLAIFILVTIPRLVHAQGAAPLLDVPLVGCYDVAVTGIGLFNDTPPTGSTNSVTINAPDGPVVAAYIEWMGAEDSTPGGSALDGTSTLMINGLPVDGTLAEPFDASGNAGYDPRAHTNAGPKGWFAWHADIGPTGLNIIPANFGNKMTLTVSGWDSPARQTNGATISLIYDTGNCEIQNEVQFLTGVNWYHHSAGAHQFSELLVYPFEPEPIDRIVRMYFSHAGTDKNQTTCRGGAVWMTADDGTSLRLPQPRDFDLVAIGDNNGDGTERGYGINGAVEILNDPFTSAAMPCSPGINLAPDEPYENGHPFPNGAETAPYRAIDITPASGGDVGVPGEWGVTEAHILIPAQATWVAFQLESEPDQDGESGSWVGGGVFLVLPTATIGDRVWHDLNGNGVQENGEPGLGGSTVTLRESGGQSLDSMVTGSNGLYLFTDLQTGDYSLRFSTPNGYKASPQNSASGPDADAIDSDADPVTGETVVTNLQPSEADVSWDAGFYRPVSVGDFVWLDDNRNGVQDVGEPGINNVNVMLAGSGPDGVFGNGDDLSYRTSTRDNGLYLFDDLAPGRYYVHFEAPVDYRLTEQGVGDPAKDSDANPLNGKTDVFELLSGQRTLDIDAGLFTLKAAIQIEKQPDIQTIDYGEKVEFAITVTNIGDVDLSDVTVSDPVSPACDRAIGDLAVRGTVRYVCAIDNILRDFTNVATVFGRDPNGNFVHDEDDAIVDVRPLIQVVKDATPLRVPDVGGEVLFTVNVLNQVDESVTITELSDDIHGNLNGQGSCVLPQIVTPGNRYTCAFVVTVIPGDNGETDTVTAYAVDDEGNGATDSDTATVLPLQDQAIIGDWVWQDFNENGLQDDGEIGVPGVRVQLYNSNDELVDETKTDANGLYRFTELREGDYYLFFIVDMPNSPFTGFTAVVDAEPSRNSDVRYPITPIDYIGGYTEQFALGVNEVDLDWDAGLLISLELPDVPKAIELQSFVAQGELDGVHLTWITGAELETVGFDLVRSTSPVKAEAVIVTGQSIPSQGSEGGSYSYFDPSALPGVTYYYWLSEREIDDDTNLYGPIRGQIAQAQTDFTVYLPLTAGQ